MRGAFAGIVAAGCWAAAEPTLGRLFGTPYSDVELLGGLSPVCPGRVTGLAIHLTNGALFGAAFGRWTRGGVTSAVAVAQVENAFLWPTMLLAERIHPACRSGGWPSLFRNRRIAAYEVVTHALFGTVLGVLAGRREKPPRASQDARTRDV